MRLLLSYCLILTLFSLFESFKHSEEILKHFAKFRAQHSKRYKNSADEETRLGHFATNHKKIAELNADAKNSGRNVTFSVNKFADKSRAELHVRLSKVPPSNHSDLQVFKPRHHRHNRIKRQTQEVPTNFDLRDVMINGNPLIGPVKNQAECGCCWAFATTAITETANALHSKQYQSLSDQEICDCAETGDTPGCVGGDPRNGLLFVHHHGQTNDDMYPYEEFRANTTGNCDYRGKAYVIQPEVMQVYRFDEDYAEDDIIENLYFNHIPSAVYFRVGENFEWYQSGVLELEKCNEMSPTEWHSAAIIGYGTHIDDATGKEINYWIVRNSWAADWGENGYVKIKRGINWCDIESHPATAMITKNYGYDASSSEED